MIGIHAFPARISAQRIRLWQRATDVARLVAKYLTRKDVLDLSGLIPAVVFAHGIAQRDVFLGVLGGVMLVLYVLDELRTVRRSKAGP